jgi:threonine/homoserine/homoserine lactone efflux protein
MAFFPLFVDPVRHQGLSTFGFMAGTIAALTFLYGALVVALTRHFADRLRANPHVVRWLNRVAGTLLLGFGLRLVLSR